MTYLAADIGGTYSRLAWIDDGPVGTITQQAFGNADFDSLESVIAHGLELLGRSGQAIEAMVLALPGPIHNDPVELTNIDWRLHRDELCRRFRVTRLTIVNDFQAAALGAVNQPYGDLSVLNPATPGEGPVVVTGAGTGLGMAWLAERDQLDLPRATEGGHMDFAPNNSEQTALHQVLASRYGHVSYERVLSGDGLLDSYRFLAGNGARADTPAAITALATQGDTHATRAVRLFVDFFAAYAGSLALAFDPRGGIYLCGGLIGHLADWFEPTAFRLAYSAKGRMADVVRRVPVYLVNSADTGLQGALRIARTQRLSG